MIVWKLAGQTLQAEASRLGTEIVVGNWETVLT